MAPYVWVGGGNTPGAVGFKQATPMFQCLTNGQRQMSRSGASSVLALMKRGVGRREAIELNGLAFVVNHSFLSPDMRRPTKRRSARVNVRVS